MSLSLQESRLVDIEGLFEKQFGARATHVVRAPGRVNLIGEHTDYNEGYVLPVAIDREMMIASRLTENSDGLVELYSKDYDETDSFSVNDIQSHPTRGWTNYLRAVLKMFQNAGHTLPPFQAVLSGDVPQGAGLSSSAAFEVAVATLLKEFLNLGLTATEIALIAQKAENEFIGVQCGIMDQFISALGEADSALMIDCRTLDFKSVPLRLSSRGYSIVITNSGVRRGLVDSAYNERRKSCQEGVKELERLLNRPHLGSLRDVRLDEFIAVSSRLPVTLSKRCHHVISENERVLLAVAALENDDLEDFGHLMNASHESLKTSFEVSCPEIDILVEMTQALPGVLGSRITGGGFGGCTVTLMPQEMVEAYRQEVLLVYERKTGCKADVYVSVASEGASFLLKSLSSKSH
jgi:galactokinase